MKRIISIFLILSLFLGCNVISVSASDFSNDSWFEVLDYYTIVDDGNAFEFTGSDFIYISLDPVKWYSAIDMIITVVGDPITSVKHRSSSSSLTILPISDNIYRVYGNVVRRPYSNLFIDFVSSGTSYVEVNSIKLLGLDYAHYDEVLVGSGSANNSGDVNIGFNDPSLSNSYFYTVDDFNDRAFSVFFKCPNWRKYDYLDIQLFLFVNSISTISASCGDINLPVSTSYVSSINSSNTSFLVTARIDLTGLDRSTSDNVELQVLGLSTYPESNVISIVGCSGYVLTDPINPLFYYFRTLFAQLTSHFDSLNLWILNQTDSITSTIATWGQNIINVFSPDDDGAAEEFQESVSQQADELSGIADVMGSLDKPDLGSMNVNLDSFAVNANISGVGSLLAVPMRNEVLLQVFIMTFTFALVGYALYGKR